MTVKQIIRVAATILDLADAVEYLDRSGSGAAGASGEEGASVAEENAGATTGEATVEELLRLYNEAEKDVAVNFVPVVYEEKIEAAGGEIALSALKKKFLRVAYLYGADGGRLSYRVHDGYLKLRSAERIVVIGYAYVPEDKKQGDECEFLNMPAKAFVLGIVSAYYLQKQLFEEAEIYRGQYEAAISSARAAFTEKVVSVGRMRARRWQ